MPVMAKRLDGLRCQIPEKGGTAPNFGHMCIVAKRLDGSRCHLPLGTEVGLGRGDIALDGAQLSPKGQAPNFRPMPIVAKRWPISVTDELLCILLCRCTKFHCQIVQTLSLRDF